MMFRIAVVCGTCLLLLAGTCPAQQPPAARADEAAPDARGQALGWLDQLSIEQVLFNPEDVQAWRDAVEQMSEVDAQAWWQQHAAHRQLLDSPEWHQTRQWWRDFLKVQAIYSDEEIRARREQAFQAANQSARALSEVMQELADERAALATGSRRSADTRRLLIDLNTEFKQQQQQQRALTLQTRPTPVVTSGPPVMVREPIAPYRRPLITSMDAARWSILSNFFHRW